MPPLKSNSDGAAEVPGTHTRSTAAAADTMLRLLAVSAVAQLARAQGAAGAWEHVGPHNIFDAYNENGTGPLPMGEAGTLASAASPKANPDLIYAGGQNNGVSSGVLKTIDGGIHWTRESKGLWGEQRVRLCSAFPAPNPCLYPLCAVPASAR